MVLWPKIHNKIQLQKVVQNKTQRNGCHALVHIPSYRPGTRAARAARAGCSLRQRRSDYSQLVVSLSVEMFAIELLMLSRAI